MITWSIDYINGFYCTSNGCTWGQPLLVVKKESKLKWIPKKLKVNKIIILQSNQSMCKSFPHQMGNMNARIHHLERPPLGDIPIFFCLMDKSKKTFDFVAVNKILVFFISSLISVLWDFCIFLGFMGKVVNSYSSQLKRS